MILVLLLVFPLLAATMLLVVPGFSDLEVRRGALLAALAEGVLATMVACGFQPAPIDGAPALLPLAFEVAVPWIERFGISLHLGVDGISVFLVLLTAFLTPLVILGSWTSVTDQVRGYHAALLFLEAAMIGAFVSIDLFLFYVFWEAMLIPMYFLIGIWGGERRIYATLKFFLYTIVGSLLMLVALLGLVVYGARVTGTPTFDLPALLALDVPVSMQRWMFAAFALSFAIKVPLFPFHTWLPDAHVEAPTGGSVILAGVLLKMGTYGFLRFAMPLFPVAAVEAVPWVMGLSVAGIVYGAWVASVQEDVKKLVAYSSVSHLGFVMLGMFALTAQGLAGALLQMINHGLSTGALFLLVGMIYERRHTRRIDAFGGLASVMPRFAALFLVFTLASIGLPGLNGFIGEFLVLIGTFGVAPWTTAIAATGMIWAAVYMLTAYKRVFFGPVTHAENRGLTDLGAREVAILVALLVPSVWIGVHPGPILERIEPALARVSDGVRAAHLAHAAAPLETLGRVGAPELVGRH